MAKKIDTTAIAKAFEGLSLLIDEGSFHSNEKIKAEEVLQSIGLLMARRPEDTAYHVHKGRSIYFPRYNSKCPICQQP